MLKVTGNTYKYRATIKDLGGQWNKRGQYWQCPTSSRDKLTKLSGVIICDENSAVADYVQAQEDAYFDNFAASLDRY